MNNSQFKQPTIADLSGNGSSQKVSMHLQETKIDCQADSGGNGSINTIVCEIPEKKKGEGNTNVKKAMGGQQKKKKNQISQCSRENPQDFQVGIKNLGWDTACQQIGLSFKSKKGRNCWNSSTELVVVQINVKQTGHSHCCRNAASQVVLTGVESA
jgi:hypothetical protein